MPYTGHVRHEYCLNCDAETVETFNESGRIHCRCTTCGQVADRCLVVDGALRMWHETVGVFVRDSVRALPVLQPDRLPLRADRSPPGTSSRARSRR